jgi:hypothetical protein
MPYQHHQNMITLSALGDPALNQIYFGFQDYCEKCADGSFLLTDVVSFLPLPYHKALALEKCQNDN